MLRLLLLSMSLWSGLASAQTELLSWQELMMLNPVKRAAYLQDVSTALLSFEQGTNDLLDPNRDAEFDAVNELFHFDLNFLPQAHADDTTCSRTTFFTEAGGRVCYQTHAEGQRYGGEYRCVTTGNDAETQQVRDLAAKCPDQAQAYKATLLKPTAPPTAAAKTPTYQQQQADGLKTVDASLADVQAKKDKAAADAESAKPGSKYLDAASKDKSTCTDLKSKDLSGARRSYRGTGKGCLIGGVIAKYSSANSFCPVQHEDLTTPDAAPPTGKSASGKGVCTSTYPPNSKASAARLTVCNSLLYCKKGKTAEDTAPFCVSAGKSTQTTCYKAAKSGGDFQFGQDCLGKDPSNQKHQQWNKFKDDLAGVCQSTLGQSKALLCGDCKKLTEDIAKANVKSGAAPAGPAPASGTPTAPTSETPAAATQ